MPERGDILARILAIQPRCLSVGEAQIPIVAANWTYKCDGVLLIAYPARRQLNNGLDSSPFDTKTGKRCPGIDWQGDVARQL